MSCKHPFVRKLVRGEFKGTMSFEACLVAHFFDDGGLKPHCIKCPDCGEWISLEKQVKIKEAKDG